MRSGCTFARLTAFLVLHKHQEGWNSMEASPAASVAASQSTRVFLGLCRILWTGEAETEQHGHQAGRSQYLHQGHRSRAFPLSVSNLQ